MAAPPFKKTEWILIFAIVIAAYASFFGINWGRYEEWNPDTMAFKYLSDGSDLKPPYNPEYFLRPPFHLYFNHFLSDLPLTKLSTTLNLPQNSYLEARLIWSRLLTFGMFVLALIIFSRILNRFSNPKSERILLVLFATSAGFYPYVHFLTSDIPVMFWMLVSFYYSSQIYPKARLRFYLLAGFFAGLAAATKYNGLLVAVAMVMFHWLTPISTRNIRQFFNSKIMLGSAFVLIGFIVGNPFVILDWHSFIRDFQFLMATDTLYEGASLFGYFNFFAKIIYIIGLPALIVVLVSLWHNLKRIFITKEADLKSKVLSLATLAVLLSFWLFFGTYKDVYPRSIMPVVPFLLLATSGGWQKIAHFKFFRLIFLLLISYNLISLHFVVIRFIQDPRMESFTWVKNNLPPYSTIEQSTFVPDWNLDQANNYRITKIPQATGRESKFKTALSQNGNTTLLPLVEKYEGKLPAGEWFTKTSLLNRSPDYIVIDSLDYKYIYFDTFRIENAEIVTYYTSLLNEELPYQIIYDRQTPTIPLWVYPSDIVFLENRLVILKRL